MKKISILVYDITLIGGAEKVAINLANELSKIYNVSLISMFFTNENPISAVNNNVRLVKIEKKPVSLVKKIFALSSKLKKELENNNTELILSITAGMNSIVTLATRNNKIKTIYAEHSNLKNTQYGAIHKFRQRLGAKQFDRIVALTKEDVLEFKNRFKIIDDKISYIYNWIEPSVIDNKYNVNSKTILSIGRLVKVKGYDRMIDIAAEVFNKHPDWKWEIYGDGEEKQFIETKIIEKGLEDNVYLRGFSNNVDSVLKQGSFLVSTSYFEGFPLSFLEAREFKLPIVSFDCPTGPREIINDNVDGYLIENYNNREMVMKINMLIENPEIRKYFSENIDCTKHKFEKDNLLEQWISLIEGVI